MTNTLRKDFERFSRLHSWYKHNSLEGTTFYFFQTTGQQLSTGEQLQYCAGTLDLNDYDLSGIHWHFSRSFPNDIDTPIYEVKFGCFLRGLEIGGQGPIYEDNKDKFNDWILEHYPEYSDVNWDNEKYRDFNSIILKELFTKEYNKYWNDVCKAFISSLTQQTSFPNPTQHPQF